MGHSRRWGLPLQQHGDVRSRWACPWKVHPAHGGGHLHRDDLERRRRKAHHRLLHPRAVDLHNPAVIKKAPREVLFFWLVQYPKIVSFKIFRAIIAIGKAGIAAIIIPIGAARLPSAFLRRNQAAKGVIARKLTPMMSGHASRS